MRQRFAKFHNLPELMRTFHLVADIQTAEMLNLPRPGIIGGKAEVVSTAATEYQQTLMKEFVARAEAIRQKEVSPHIDKQTTVNPGSDTPKNGDKKPGYIYVEGFGWIADEGGQAQGESIDSDGDINKQVGNMG